MIRRGLEWADRAVVAEGAVPSDREELLLSGRTAASFRLGDVNSAKRLAGQLNDHYPFDTWRGRVPNDRNSETDRGAGPKHPGRAQSRQEMADHLDPDVDFGVAPDDVLQEPWAGKTPTTAPGVTTVNTETTSRRCWKTRSPWLSIQWMPMGSLGAGCGRTRLQWQHTWTFRTSCRSAWSRSCAR